MNTMLRFLSLCCVCLLSAAPSLDAATEWPHLRGPNLDGRVAAGELLGQESVGLKLAWSSPLGSGYSGVAVAGGRAVTMYSDGRGDYAAAFDVETGERLWRYRIAATYKGHDGSDDGPLSSPVIDDGVVYGLGPSGQLFALGLGDGKELWKKTLKQDFDAEAPDFGFTTTPLVEGNVLVVQTGGAAGKAISGLDKKSGKLLWSRGDDKVEYQSPAVLELAGRRQLVAISGKRIQGLEPATGKTLWEHELGEEEFAGSSTPGYAGESRFLATIGGAVAVFQVDKSMDGFEVQELFRSKELGGTYAVPVYHDGHLYGFRGQFLTCVNAENGERVWKSRPPGGRGLILVDGHLVIFGAEGNGVVAAATPEGYVEKAKLQALDGSGYTWPSFAGGKVFVRNLETLAAVTVAGGATAASPASVTAAEAAPHEFGRFVQSLAEAADKPVKVEQFMQSRTSFPIVEGPFVHFVYRGEVEDLAIAGTMIESGLPEPMERVPGTDLFHRTFRLEPGARYEYQLNVNYDERVPDPLNPRTVPGRFGDQKMSEVVMPGYEVAAHLREPDGGRRGTLESFDYKSERLGNERKITVYLPPGYAESGLKYPLLVVHQGPDWLERGLMANSLDNLIGGGRVSPLVVAFVPPAEQWWLEGGGSKTDDYARMLAEELVPHLESKYRLVAHPGARAVMGTTYFGVTAAFAALKYPTVFSKVAIQSVALGLGSDDALMTLLESAKPSDVRFYLDWNRFEARNVDTSLDLGEDARTLAAALEQNGFGYSGGEALDSFGWGSWRARTDRILESFFPAE